MLNKEGTNNLKAQEVISTNNIRVNKLLRKRKNKMDRGKLSQELYEQKGENLVKTEYIPMSKSETRSGTDLKCSR